MGKDLVDSYLHFSHRNRDAKQRAEIEGARLQQNYDIERARLEQKYSIEQARLEQDAMKERLRLEQKERELSQSDRHHQEDMTVRGQHIAVIEKQVNAEITLHADKLELQRQELAVSNEIAYGRLVVENRRLDIESANVADRLAFEREHAAAANSTALSVATIQADGSSAVAKIQGESAEETERVRQRGAVAVIQETAKADLVRRRDGQVYDEADSSRRRAEEAGRAVSGAIGAALVALVQGVDTRKTAAQAERHRQAERAHEMAMAAIGSRFRQDDLTHEETVRFIMRIAERAAGLGTSPTQEDVAAWLDEWEREGRS